MAFKWTPIEQALLLAGASEGELTAFPVKRDPPDPTTEATVARYWALLPQARRDEFRAAFALLNIPMQDGLA